MSELEAQSGFDKRTIAYYIQESLLPKVGRRGRKTRYPQEFLDRLMLIRRVRDLQDAGKLRAVTLSEIREVLNSQSAEETRRASLKHASDETLRALFPAPEIDTTDFAVRAEDVASGAISQSLVREFSADVSVGDGEDSFSLSRSRQSGDAALHGSPRGEAKVPRAEAEADSSATPSLQELRSLLQEIERRARRRSEQSELRSSERLTRVPISEEILMSVRDIDDQDAHLVEELAELLRRVGRLD